MFSIRKTNLIVLSTVILTLLLTACGGSAPEATDVPETDATEASVTESASLAGPLNDNMCGSVEWENQSDCVSNIATIEYSDNIVVLAQVFADPNPVVNNATALTFDVQVTDGAGNFLTNAYCYYDGAFHPNPQNAVGVQGITKTEEHTISCEYNDEVVATGKLRYFYGSNLAMTLTAMVPTETPDANSTTTPTATSTTVP